ncbi:putative F-box protein At2g02030 [Papaver somniferum]|uniref:putative F-box protein At2g02030 n=1 Tax=Papaver somniferum TaxID=3469 RepID=UPI000E6FE4B6|nr:putative F-box protein At2g02030 [Papaver somniferum]
MIILGNGKRLTVDEDHKSKKKKRSVVKIDDACSPYFPEELIENIVIRLEAKGLSRFSCVSKKWYNFILKDSKFAFSHFIQNSKKLNLIFNLLNVPVLRDTNGSKEAYLFSLEEEEKDNDLLKYKLLPGTGYHEVCELVGYCNGLACVKLVTQPTDCYGAIHVINPTRNEALALAYITPTTQGGITAPISVMVLVLIQHRRSIRRY